MKLIEGEGKRDGRNLVQAPTTKQSDQLNSRELNQQLHKLARIIREKPQVATYASGALVSGALGAMITRYIQSTVHSDILRALEEAL